ncbi:MAG TPA: hypothetical protein DCR23_04720 [Ruminococcaceae bacterium]|nr:hypothetical protein [Oscillospiraceae bacterium]
MSYKYKRITLLSGHYGSGKTNIAVNMALDLKKQYDKVAVADLDIVNPYFRTKDSMEDFKQNGIRLIVSEYANSNLDIPALPDDMYAITDDRQLKTIIDVGGDDRGALALGRIAPQIIKENDYDMLMVINRFRPLTPDAESTLEVMREIELAGGIKFTGLINNSNLGAQTEKEDVLSSVKYANEVSALSGLPVVLTTVEERLYNMLSGEIENLFALKLQKRPVD